MVETARPTTDWAAKIDELGEYGEHKIPFASSTLRNMDHIDRKWKEEVLFCLEANLGDSPEALRHCKASHIKTFFCWLVANAERTAQQSISLKSYFRRFKQIFKALTGNNLDEDTVRDVNAYIDHHLEGKQESSPRAKPVPSGEDFVEMLHSIYLTDDARYPDERQRVQQAFLMIVHAYSGLRPSSTTRSGSAGSKPVKTEEKSTNEEIDVTAKLRYRDFTLVLTKDKHDNVRFAVLPLFIHFKNEIQRKQNKHFTWFDQPDVLTCPVAHLVALALYDEAFKVPSLDNARSVFSKKLPRGKVQVVLHWKDEVLDRPIFRSNCKGTPDKELSNNMAAKRLHRLGKIAIAYKESLTWYCLRRMVLNAVDGIGSDEMRNQIAGHLDSRTYRMHYQDQHINLDVANIVRGQPTEDALLRQLNCMGARKDRNANVALPDGFNQEVEALPDVIALDTECRALKTSIRRKYGTITSAPESDPLMIKRKEARLKHKAKKQFYRARKLNELREEYFVRNDDAIIEAQLTDDDEMSIDLPAAEAPVDLIPERAKLAEFIGIEDPRTSCKRAEAVQIMVDLCSRVEPNKRFARMRTLRPQDLSEHPADTTDKDVVPMQCHSLQCLFCLGDGKLLYEHRIKMFSEVKNLWSHAKVHLDAIEASCEIRCPHPACKANGTRLNTVEHLLSHAQSQHGIRLRCR